MLLKASCICQSTQTHKEELWSAPHGWMQAQFGPKFSSCLIQQKSFERLTFAEQSGANKATDSFNFSCVWPSQGRTRQLLYAKELWLAAFFVLRMIFLVPYLVDTRIARNADFLSCAIPAVQFCSPFERVANCMHYFLCVPAQSGAHKHLHLGCS